MSTQENLMESLIELVNRHFNMQIDLTHDNMPVVSEATPKNPDSLTTFLNDMITLVETLDDKGKINYYLGNELDYDTPEEFYRY